MTLSFITCQLRLQDMIDKLRANGAKKSQGQFQSSNENNWQKNQDSRTEDDKKATKCYTNLLKNKSFRHPSLNQLAQGSSP